MINEKIKFRSASEIMKICEDFMPSYHDAQATGAEIWLKGWKAIGCPTDQVEIQVSKKYIQRFCMNKLRSHSTEQRVLKKVAMEPKARKDWPAIEEQFKNLMDQSMLTNKQSEVLSRFFFNNQSLSQIANSWGTSIAAVSTCLHAGLEELKRVARKDER